MKNPQYLLNDAKKVYSQNGEEGIIERMLQIIPARDNWCVEFGAWDGQHLSNTRYFIENYGFNAVLIEGDPVKFRELTKFYCENDKIIPINRFVGWSKPNTLDQILSETEIPKNFDFLSIDIDGNDYHVLAALSEYKPKVICVEYNPSIPNEVEFIQKADLSITQGSSLLSFVKLGKHMGYELVAILHGNAFFVGEKYFPLFGIEDNSLSLLRDDSSSITYLFVGFDGTIFLSGRKDLPWHGIPIHDENIQILPRYLRAFPDNYSTFQKYLFWIFKQFLRIKSKFRSE